MITNRAVYIATIRQLRAAASQAGKEARAKRDAAKADEGRARTLRAQATALQEQFDRVIGGQQ